MSIDHDVKMYDLTDGLKVGIQVLDVQNLGGGEFTYSGFEIFTYKENPDGGWEVKEVWAVKPSETEQQKRAKWCKRDTLRV